MRRTPAFVALLALTLLAFDAGSSQPIRPGAIRDRVERETGIPPSRYVIAAAGDIACDHAPNGPSAPSLCQYDDTARLIDRGDLSAVLLLGDVVMPLPMASAQMMKQRSGLSGLPGPIRKSSR